MDRTRFLLLLTTLFLVYCCLANLTIVAAQPNITTDQSALLSLKSHITSDPQNITANWSTTTFICNWVGVTCGARHIRVSVLNLSYMGLTGTIPPDLGNLSFLVELHLRKNSFHGTLPEELAHLRRLKLISFGYNNFMGIIPSWFGSFPKLQTLNLYGNQFTGSIPTAIFNLSALQVVSLSNNQLSGSIPREIGNLTMLKEIYLDYNNFQGTIPDEIGDLQSLQNGGLQDLVNLSLANNNLEGPIPSSFGNLLSLELLDLSRNNLSGAIPMSLQALIHLKYLNLSFNRLQGEIPTGGPFKNFSAQSFVSNNALCGAPQLHVPPCKNSTVLEPHSREASTSILKYIIPGILVAMFLGIFISLLILPRKRNVEVATETTLLPQLDECRKVSYQELLRATNGFNESNLLGTGGFGSVYKGTLLDGIDVAVKVFNLQMEGGFKSLESECEMLSNIRHRNLIKIISCCSETDFKALVLNYMPNGSLEKWLYSQKYSSLNILQRLNIMIDVASALEYLHHGYSLPIVHCDLKPSNVLLDDDMVAHVADFGIAKLLGGGDSMTQATNGYMAPEYGMEGIVSTRGDVYGFGILLMETFTKRKPTDEMFVGEMNLKQWIANSLFHHAVVEVVDAYLLGTLQEDHDFVSKIDCLSSIMSLALGCCAESPEERTNMKDAVVTINKIKIKFLKDMEGLHA